MARYVATTAITTNTSVELTAIAWPKSRPQDGIATMEIFANGTFGGGTLQITAEPNTGVAAIPVTGAVLTEEGSLTVGIAADKYYARLSGSTGASVTVYYRLVG